MEAIFCWLQSQSLSWGTAAFSLFIVTIVCYLELKLSPNVPHPVAMQAIKQCQLPVVSEGQSVTKFIPIFAKDVLFPFEQSFTQITQCHYFDCLQNITYAFFKTMII